MTDMIIRQANAEDAEAIYEIEHLCFPDPWSLESIRYEMEQNPAAFYVVAEIDGEVGPSSEADPGDRGSTPEADLGGDRDPSLEADPGDAADKLIVGYAGLWWIENEGHITNVAVRPGYRNRRIGSQIVETLIDFTQEEGIDDFTLEVRRSNLAAIGLYEKFGFEVEGVRKNYYRHGREDALILWRRRAMLR